MTGCPNPAGSNARTPLFDALVRLAASSRASLHVPGHHDGRLFPECLGPWFGPALRLDLTELPGLDNLQAPSGCIATSQELASQHYGAEETLYSVNGSSAAVMAAVMASAWEGQVLVAGAFHQSLWRGLVLAGADAVFCPPRWDEETLEPVAPAPAAIHQVLDEHPDVAAVFVTSPVYTGRVAPVAALAAVAHAHGVPLIVDEAHGAHFGLHPHLPPHSVAEGADVVIQSVHKTLPALTQTAWVHRSGSRVDKDRLREALRTVQTTSPSYLLLASLDAAQAWLRTSARPVVSRALQALAAEGAPVDGQRDPFRLWLPTGSTPVSQALEQSLAAAGRYVEYANPLGVLCMLPLDIAAEELRGLLGLLADFGVWPAGWARPRGWSGNACTRRDAGEAAQAQVRLRPAWLDLWRASTEAAVTLQRPPRALVAVPRRRVPLSACAGEQAAEMVVPYPPGVPVLLPGQEISTGAAALLSALYRAGTPVIGMDPEGCVQVAADGPRGGHTSG
ncbi:MAG: aminotransferase class I/II-fold pyridoxal phosphate-dependent enzyme [Alicyclobacillus sp.]|nr:aminotransferase class I/II-fold pyridoxal phosphate-dependent enzyme [Alicyclobacillus sp.]